MKKIVALMMLLCLVVIPACANDNADGPDMPETHAAAIDPDKVKTVRLIHGKGTGALRQALQRFLRGDPRVGAFRLGKYGEGDSGVTIVELK